MRIGGQCRRDLRAVLFAAWLLFGGLYVLPAARGDDDGGQGWFVPNSECPCPPENVLVPPGCTVAWRCTRWDGHAELVAPGVLVILPAQLDCNTCQECCADPQSTTHCTLASSLCDSREFSFSIAPGIEFGIEWIKGQLGAQFGYLWETTHCWTVELGNSAVPPCVRRVYYGELSVRRGRVAQVTHSYRWHYTLGDGCENAGHWSYGPWCASTRSSSLASTWWAQASVRVESTGPCVLSSNQKDSIR